MAATIPRAELAEVGRRHSIDYDVDCDPTIHWVRGLASGLRAGAGLGSPSDAVLAEANELDALADRYEQKAGA